VGYATGEAREPPLFTQRATVMLTQLFLAAREEGASPLPYVRQIIRTGLLAAAARLEAISPELATQFLDVEFAEANFSDRFLLSAWGTLSARMRPLLTETVVRSLAGADFSARELMCGPRPTTVYLRWPERDLLALSPLVRLLWGSLIDELITTYDAAQGKECRPVLLLIDEAGRTAIPSLWRKGCTPPDAVNWTNIGNNKAFLAQTVVMTPNPSLSIPSALRTARPADYDKNAATIDWPDGANGQPLVIDGGISRAVVFKAGRNPALAADFVRFLTQEGWLAHWLDFAGDRYLPPMRKLVEEPFWLNPSDPHRMRAAIQIMTRPHLMNMDVRDHEWHSGPIWDENVWGKAVHRVVTEGISPAQAVDEAIARIKQILKE
jgi:hypothetical protein